MNPPDRYRKVALSIGLVVLLAVAGCATDHDMNVPTNMTTMGDDKTAHLAPSETSTKSTTESTNTTIDRPIDTTTA